MFPYYVYIVLANSNVLYSISQYKILTFVDIGLRSSRRASRETGRCLSKVPGDPDWRPRGPKFGKFHKICQILEGSFSALSKPIFASKYTFCRIVQALQELHIFAALQLLHRVWDCVRWRLRFLLKKCLKISDFGTKSEKKLRNDYLPNLAKFLNLAR